MSSITLFHGTFCNEDDVVRRLLKKTDYTLVTDKILIGEASGLSELSEDKVERALSAKASVFNRFTHEWERSIASLKLALAERLQKDNLLILGFTGLLIPMQISHVLRVCLIAGMKFRKLSAKQQGGLSEKESTALIHQEDTDRAKWIDTMFGKANPWDTSLYDIVIPVDKKSEEEVVELIVTNLNSKSLNPTEASRKAVDDFLLAGKVEVVLAREGHSVEVNAKNGNVTLTINKHVLMLNRLEDELQSIVRKVEGVRSVETTVGKNYYKTDIYRKYDFDMPSKVLLVDDEHQFVETLSERLIIRDIGSAVAYDGQSALDLIAEDEPEVMILDLKMPGIDGIEVLRRVKATRPDIEVIILTGHGSEADKEVCMKLGAFAYLNKPVNIEFLSDALRRANEAIKQKTAKKK
ncbi:MAG: response regulator [Desulfobacteraceae bacterium]|nr:response regulator [Pseudomonadota bacterium]MBU4463794.1 response regulator [Pseudomonadota bacterium]MCG2755734.1 response regulator [Desulfobacteraceae bacterium]